MEKLKQVLRQGDTVLFVGSGVSLWSGLPSWSQLIEDLAQFVEETGANADLVRAEAKRGDLLQAASYGFYKLTKPQIGEFVRKACRYGTARPHEIHRKVISLGPRLFVTTNYDSLIEESLRIWQPDRFFRTVTNRNLTETAEIVHARATHFVFKPHGDAGDSDSIVLTREQYRQLLPGGERQAALESVKMLLATRPVVYVGFGLRDPDFMYVRDLLANTYKGGIRDHYAIMADVLDPEVDYWRMNYGIHLVGYGTAERADKTKDHAALLKLLDDLCAPALPVVAPAPAIVGHDSSSSDRILALARHAAGLTRAPKHDPEFPIRVLSERTGRARGASDFQLDEFDHFPVELFLREGPPRAILIGPPGSGKSYSLQRSAAFLAEKLHKGCLTENFDESSLVVPLLADLKLYRGDLQDLLARSLPNGLSLPDLCRRYKVKIFLDSFNEMPREYWDTGSYEADFSRVISGSTNTSFIIGSRTDDGLSKVGFPCYRLDLIDEEFVAAELDRLGIEVSGRFRSEVQRLLQKPFYFQLVASRAVSLPRDCHPKDFYQTFFAGLTASFEKRFGHSFNLEYALSLAAYDAVNRGEEAQPLANVLETLQTQLEGEGLGEIQAPDVANWLVSKSVIVPYRGARVALFHQSATEYLAACELARRYQQNAHTLKEKLSLTRWDQALFLTLSLLPSAAGSGFLKTVVEADFALALNATKYLEFDRDRIVSKLLAEIPSRMKASHETEHQIESAIRHGLALSDIHEQPLRSVMNCGGLIGAAAVGRLVELKGISVKAELLHSFIEARDDYNYCCHGLASALQPFAASEDIAKIVDMADSIREEVPPNSSDEVAHGFTSGAAQFLCGLDLASIREAFLPKEESERLSEVRARILCNILWKLHSTDALELAAELLIRNVYKAATAIYFISNFAKADDCLSWAVFSREHVDRLVSNLRDETDESWGLKALKCLCAARPDLAEGVRIFSSGTAGIFKAALLYCASPADTQPVFAALGQFPEMSVNDRGQQRVDLLKQIELNWTGHEALLLQLLRLRDTRLALVIVGEIYNGFLRLNLRELEIGPIEWWLDWLAEETETESGPWFHHLMAWLFARVLSAQARHTFVAEFNNEASRFRGLLAHLVLPYFPDLTTDSFSEDAVSFLLAELSRVGIASGFHGSLLGSAATEQFVTERILPLMPDARPPLSDNLLVVLHEAGSRHGRRYIRA